MFSTSFRRRHALLASLLSAVGVIVYLGYITGLFDVAQQAPMAVLDAPTSTPITSVTSTTTSSTIITNALVVRVVDGDTLDVKLDGESTERKVRLLGINTPETVDPRKTIECFGKEASSHLRSLLEAKRVRLEADPQADERDKYNRLLKNVILPDGTDVNAEEVREGYAYAYLSFPLNPQRKQQLKKLQEDAKLAERGLWSPETCSGQK